MLERIYIDNVRSFVNFEWNPERFSLLLGTNGAGKSALFEVLFALRGFLMGDLGAAEAFQASSHTRWDTRSEQTIELGVLTPQGRCRYRLVLREGDGGEPVVVSETLEAETGFVVELGGGQLRSGLAAPPIPWTRFTRSAVGMLDPGTDPALRAFQEQIAAIWLIRPNPRAMSGRVDRRRISKAPWLEPDLSNFAAWYLPMLASKPGSVFKATHALQGIMPGLEELFESDGSLAAHVVTDGKTSAFVFEELSDGERALVALYVLLHVAAVPGAVLLFDEPDNFVALREIQPWLMELVDRALATAGPQVMVVSHHPEALDLLAPEKGWRVFRVNAGPTRIERFRGAEGLSPGEAVARGWDEPT